MGTSPTPRSHTRFVAILAAVLAGLGILAIVAYFQPWRPSLQESPDPTAWKTYTNTKYGFEFKYPSEWMLEEPSPTTTTGEIVSLRSPETSQLLKESKIDAGYSHNLVLSFWPNINNQYARGGTWVGQRNYTSLADYFTDKKAPKQKIGTINVADQTAYEASINGAGSNYGVMLEHAGIYELSFETTPDKSKLGDIENQILSTFRFTNIVTMGWKDFSSKYFKLSFKVPADWFIEDSYDAITVSQVFIDGESPAVGPGMALVRYTPSFTRESSIASFRQRLTQITTSTISVDGTSFTRMDGVYEPSKSRAAIILFDASVLSLGFEETMKDGPNSALLSQILSTFKFTNAATSTWKTYKGTSGRFSYEFKYPAEWPVPETSQEEVYTVVGLGPMFKGACEGLDCVLTSFAINTAALSVFGKDSLETPEKVLQDMETPGGGTLISDTIRSDGARIIISSFTGMRGGVRADIFYPATQRELHAEFSSVAEGTERINQFVSTFKFTK